MTNTQMVYNLGFEDGLYGFGLYYSFLNIYQDFISDYEAGFDVGTEVRIDNLADASYAACFE